MHTLSYLRENFQALDRQALSAALEAMGIKAYYKENRYIFACGKPVRFNSQDPEEQKLGQQMISECNGLVAEYSPKGWNILALPPRTMVSNNIDVKYVNAMSNKYEVVRVTDGTLIKLYFYKGLWRISTHHGIEVNDTHWSGTSGSYMDLFKQAIADMGKEHMEFLSALDKKTSYCFILTCRALQPLCPEGKSHLTWVQSTNLETLETTYVNDLGIPTQESVIWPTRPNGRKNIHDLFELNEAALDVYMHDKTENYGFILRSTIEDMDPLYSMVLLESSLLRFVKNRIYHHKFRTQSGTYGVEREQYLVLYNYVEDSIAGILKMTFADVFPQYAEDYKKIGSAIEHLIDLIDIQLRAKSGRKLPTEAKEEKASDKDAVFVKQADILATEIDSVIKIDKYEKAVIRGFILDKKYIPVFLPLL